MPFRDRPDIFHPGTGETDTVRFADIARSISRAAAGFRCRHGRIASCSCFLCWPNQCRRMPNWRAGKRDDPARTCYQTGFVKATSNCGMGTQKTTSQYRLADREKAALRTGQSSRLCGSPRPGPEHGNPAETARGRPPCASPRVPAPAQVPSGSVPESRLTDFPGGGPDPGTGLA